MRAAGAYGLVEDGSWPLDIGDRVRTPDGTGTIIQDRHGWFIVQLESGAISAYVESDLTRIAEEAAVLPFDNTVLVSGAKEEAKLCWGFGTTAKWSKLVISSSLAVIDRLSTGLNPEDLVKAIANLLVIDNFVSFNALFELAEANFTWNRIGLRNDNGIYLLIGTIPPPGFTKVSTQTVQYFSQIEYEA